MKKPYTDIVSIIMNKILLISLSHSLESLAATYRQQIKTSISITLKAKYNKIL